MATYITINRKGKYHDYDSKEIVINYILNPMKSPSNYIGFIGVNPYDINASMHECSAVANKDNGIQIRHFVVSFERYEIPDAATANAIANELMICIGQQYPCFYAVHENTDNVHFHMAFNNVSYTGQRYYGTKKEFYDMINTLKFILRKYGIKILQTKYHKDLPAD